MLTWTLIVAQLTIASWSDHTPWQAEKACLRMKALFTLMPAQCVKQFKI